MSQSHAENIYKTLEIDYCKFKSKNIVIQLKQNYNDKILRFLFAMFKKKHQYTAPQCEFTGKKKFIPHRLKRSYKRP